MQVDDGIDDFMNVLHELNTFIFISLHILKPKIRPVLALSKFLTSTTAIKDRVVLEIAGMKGVPKPSLI
jgi:hypothetical protein